MTYYQPTASSRRRHQQEGGRRLKPAYKGGRCNKLHLAKEDGAASCTLEVDGGTSSSLKAIVTSKLAPPVGRGFASPHTPLPIVSQHSWLPPLVVLAGLTFSSSSSDCSSRMLASFALRRRRHRELCPSSSSFSCRLSLGAAASCCYSRSSSSLLPARPKGRLGELPLLLSHAGEALPPPHPHPIVEPLKRFSSTGCSRLLDVPPAFVRLDHRTLASPLARRRRWPHRSSLVVSCRLSLVGRLSKLSLK